MINTTASAVSSISTILSENLDALNTSMTRIASGKKVETPGDNLASFAMAQNMQSDVATLQTVQQDLTAGKGLTDYAQAVGNAMVEDTTRLQNLQTQYTAAAGNAAAQNAYAAQYAGVFNSMTNLAANAQYNGTAVYQSGTTLANINLGTGGANLTVSVQANQIPDLTTIGNVATVTAADLQNALQGAQSYVAAIQGFGNAIETQQNLTATAIAAKNANISQLVDVNDVEELGNITNAQVRNQAAVAMAAQANIAQASIARLYQ